MYLLKGPLVFWIAALFKMSKRTVPLVTMVVYGAGIGLPTLVTFQSCSMVTVIAEGGVYKYTKYHVSVTVTIIALFK